MNKQENNQSKAVLNFVKFWLPFLVWALIIFLFSSRSTTPASEVYWKDFVLKKTAHVVEYGVFATLLFRAQINSGIKKKKAAIFSVIVSVVYGLTDEFHQSFTPGREPKIRDVVFDTFGATLAMLIVVKWLVILPDRLKKLAKDCDLL